MELWNSLDIYGFKKRMQDAHADYVEFLEEDMDDFIKESKHNTQIARIFRLRAEAPEKYREEVKVLGVSAPLEMLDRLKALAAKALKAREALEASAVEGEFREVGHESPPMQDNPGSRAPDPSRLASPPPSHEGNRASGPRASAPPTPKKPKKEPGRAKRR